MSDNEPMSNDLAAPYFKYKCPQCGRVTPYDPRDLLVPLHWPECAQEIAGFAK